MKKFFFILMVSMTTSLMVNAKTNMNLEGSCSGKLADDSSISFTYYSDFDGCKAMSNAGMTINDEKSVLGQGLATGTRSFTETQDIYSFKTQKLVFANSTGNTSGKFTYKDQNNKSHTVVLACEIRNYEYADCQ